MRCIILNKSYPPNPSPTGYYASKLVQYLEDKGIEVTVVTTDAEYFSVKSNAKSRSIYRIRSIYQGKNKYLRIISSLYDGYRLINCAAKLKIGFWICMTDPPLLNLWVGFKAKRLNIPWAYWSMDLYPDAFWAAGLANKSSYSYRIISHFVKKNQPNCLIALGPQQAQYLSKEYGWSLTTFLLPCGIDIAIKSENRPSWAKGEYEIILGYVGNIGEAHSAEFVIETIRQIDFKKHRFILSVYGKHANLIINSVKDINGVIIMKTITQLDLQFIDIHLVTLLPKWNHICVPSKAIHAICQGGTILYYGPETSDIWYHLSTCGWRVDPNIDMKQQIKLTLDTLSHDNLMIKKRLSKLLSKELSENELNTHHKIYRHLLNFKDDYISKD